MGDHKRTRTAAQILWGHCRRTAAIADADAQAVSARVRTARAGGGATGEARVTLTSADG